MKCDAKSAVCKSGWFAGACLFGYCGRTFAYGRCNLCVAGGVFWDQIMPSFWVLVDLFMMLSGFGLCAGYLNKFNDKSIDINEFYKRRYSKILPFFAVTTLIGVVAEHSLRGIAEGVVELSLLFGFLPNNSNCFHVNGVCWTLGTIFAFYIIFPYIAFLLKNRHCALLAFAGALVLQMLCELYFTKQPFVVEAYSGRTNILYALPLFLAGCLIYLYRSEIETVVRRWQWLMLCLCVLVAAAYYILPDAIGRVGITDLKALTVFAAWIIYAIGARSKILNNRVMLFVSKISMEIYLSHMIMLKGIHILKIDVILGHGVISYFFSYIVLISGTIIFVLALKRSLQYIALRFSKLVRRA